MSFNDLFSPKGWNKIIKRLNWTDVALVKLASMVFGLFVASYFTDMVVQYRWWLLGLVVILSILSIFKSLK